MIIVHGKVFIDGQFHETDLRITGKKISEIGPRLQDEEKIDVQGALIFPGFIDTHIHGAGTGQLRRKCGGNAKDLREAAPIWGNKLHADTDRRRH